MLRTILAARRPLGSREDLWRPVGLVSHLARIFGRLIPLYRVYECVAYLNCSNAIEKLRESGGFSGRAGAN